MNASKEVPGDSERSLSIPALRTPDIQGSLQKTPLPHLLVHVLARALTGTLGLQIPNARGSVSMIQLELLDGAPVGSSVHDEVARGAAAEGGSYEFFAHDVPPETGASAPDPLATILVAARAEFNRGRIRQSLETIARQRFALHAHAELERFAPNAREREVLTGASSSTVAALLAKNPHIEALLFALLVTAHLDVGKDQWPLGVLRPNDPTVAGTGGSPTPANDCEAREDLAEVQRVLHASDCFARAESKLAQGTLDEAEKLAREAHEHDPTNIEIRTLLGWLVGLRRDPQDLLPALILLDGVLAEVPRSVRALTFRANLLTRAGKLDSASKDWRDVLDIDATNVDALRALRGTDRVPHDSPKATPRTPGAPPEAERRRVLKIVLLGAASMLLLAAAGLGVAWWLEMGTREMQEVHDQLAGYIIDQGLGSKLRMVTSVHEAALDRLGPPGARMVVTYLTDSDKAAVQGSHSDRSMQQAALRYLDHFATISGAKPPPPAVELARQLAERTSPAPTESRWESVRQAYDGWLTDLESHAKR